MKGIVIALVSAVVAQAQTPVTLQVNANTDIYRAGGYNDGSDGTAPVTYSFTAGLFQTLTFSSVTGTWTCSGGVAQYGPDGTAGGRCYHTGGQEIDNPTGPFAGYNLTDFTGGMVGVFLGDSLPPAAPPALRFYFSDNSQGGIQTDFPTLAPKVGEVFFIGDGLRGTGSGSNQVFSIPPTATHLYLGYIDSCAQPGPSAPGCFSDNAGSITAVFQIEEHQLNWIQPQEPVSPPGRCCMGIAYDPAMAASVMFGGFTNPTILNDTWTWSSGQGWSQLFPTTSPSPRESPAMAYDGAAGNIVLFGGSNANSNGIFYNDTWIWDGTTWTQQFPAISPPVRQFGAMAYDAATRTVVLFGGFDGYTNPLGDTWTWNGLTKSWTQHFPATSPSPRQPAMMAYDDATKTVVLFSGSDGSSDYTSFNDTWTWNGTAWTQQFPASIPSPREQAVGAYDALLGSVVLFGGVDGPGGELNDTWIWTGTNWQQLHPAAVPTGRWVAGMDYDPIAQRLLLFSGFGTHTLDDTWLFGLVPVTP
jgi:hypothetical protein